MSSPIDTYEGASVVYTFGANSVGTWLFLVLAVLLFIGFLARMIQHENRAYAAVIAKEAPEKGPAVEGEPPA